MEKRMKNAFLISTCLIVSLFSLTKAAWTPPAASAWKSLSNNLGVSMKATNATVAPVGVDRTTGWLIVQPWGNGVWRSTNQGQTFSHIENTFTGDHGVWSSMGVTVCPDDGKKIAIWAQYNGPGNTGFTVDGGATWHMFGTMLTPGRNFDHGAINWYDDCKIVFGQAHEGDGLQVSRDSGKTWVKVNKSGYVPGILNNGILVASGSNEVIRSTDTGRTFVTVGAFSGKGPLTHFKGKPYWLSDNGVMTTADTGKTWTMVGTAFPSGTQGFTGPFFGRDENQIVVLTTTGFYETMDAGQTWYLLAPLPITPSGVWAFPWSYTAYQCGSSGGYDPVHDNLYIHAYPNSMPGNFSCLMRLQLQRWDSSGIESDKVQVPTDHFSLQVSPNPFNGVVRIQYNVPEKQQRMIVRIYNVQGQLVGTMVDKTENAGQYSIIFNGVGKNGCALVNGAYFCRMQASGFDRIQKMVLVR
jgi:hypothetical protein